MFITTKITKICNIKWLNKVIKTIIDLDAAIKNDLKT